MSRIPIVFSTDHNYVMPTGVTIASLLLSSERENYDIYILAAPDVDEDDRRLLQRQVNELSPSSTVSFLNMGDRFKGGYEIRGISKACYYRLMIPWLIPDVDKILYCDVDIIFKTSAANLYDIDMEGMFVAGSKPFNPEGWKIMEKYFKKIGLDYRTYINSGVLVINSRLQRENQLDKIYTSLSEKKYHFQDQDIINIACKGKIAYFDKRFNLMASAYGVNNDLIDNLIIHYAGDKPWKSFTFAWIEWWEVYRKTIFADERFYHDVCRRILCPDYQIKLMRKKLNDKVKQYMTRIVK